MSIELMSHAWKASIKTSSKMVLLALCDNANEQGRCFPSIKTIALRCSMSVRSVQNQIAILMEKGYLTKQERMGRSSLYFITDPCKWCTPANSAPLQTTTQTPANHDETPAQFAGGGANAAPITITQSSHNHKRTTNKGVCVRDLIPTGVEQDVWDEFVDMRKRAKAELTEYAARLIAKELSRIDENPNEVLNRSIMNSWKSVFPKNARSPGQKKDSIPRSGFEQLDYEEAF